MKNRCLNLDNIVFTDHSIGQFIKRFPITLENPEETILDLLKQAQPEKYSTALVRRLIKNDCEYVEYWVSQEWRFVIKPTIDDKLIIFTVEPRRPF